MQQRRILALNEYITLSMPFSTTNQKQSLRHLQQQAESLGFCYRLPLVKEMLVVAAITTSQPASWKCQSWSQRGGGRAELGKPEEHFYFKTWLQPLISRLFGRLVNTTIKIQTCYSLQHTVVIYRIVKWVAQIHSQLSGVVGK